MNNNYKKLGLFSTIVVIAAVGALFAYVNASASYYPVRGCELTIQKSVDTTKAYDGDILTYTLNIKNVGTGNCTGGGVKIEDTVDSRLEFVREWRTYNIAPGYGSSPVYTSATRILTWNADVLEPGETGSISWEAKVVNTTCAVKEVQNIARITSWEYNWSWVYSNTVVTDVSSKSCGDFTLICETSAVEAEINESVHYVVTVEPPAGASYAWSGTDGLVGSTMTVSKAYSSIGTKNATVTVVKNGITKQASCSVKIIEKPIPKECKLKITKHVDKSTALNGETLTYKIAFENIGTKNCTGGGVKIEDTLDTKIDFISESHTSNVVGGYGSTPLYNASTRILTWNADVLVPGESGEVEWKGKVTTSSCTATNLKNIARISAYELNWNWINSNEVSTSVTSNDCTDLVLRCDVSPNSGLVGDSFTWKGIPSGGTGKYTYSWTGSDGLTGSTQSVSKVYSSAGSKTGSVTVVSGSRTKTASCDISVVEKPVEKYCKLIIEKQVDKSSVGNDGIFKYRIDFKNTGTKNCTGGGVKIEDILDSKLDMVSDDHSSNVLKGYGSTPFYDSATKKLTWNADTLTPGESGWVEIGVQAKHIASCSSVDIPNSARITASELGWSWVNSNSVTTKVIDTNCGTTLSLSCDATPTSGKIGDTFTFIANPSGGTGTYSYSWTGTDSLSGNTKQVNKSYSSSGSKNGTVTVTSGTDVLTRTCVVTVVDKPVIVPPVLLPYCEASTPKVRVTWNHADRGNDGYNVDIDNDNNWSNGGWSMFVPSGTTVLDTNGGFANFGGTSGTLNLEPNKTYQLRVYYKYTGDYTSAVSFTTTSCGGGGGQFTLSCDVAPTLAGINETVNWKALPSGGTGTYSYSWTGSDGLSGSSANVSKAYQSEGQKSGTVTVTSGTETLSRTCVARVEVRTTGCTQNCGGGGLNPPNVNLISQTKVVDQPLASGFVYLSQVPYTGLDAYSFATAAAASVFVTIFGMAIYYGRKYRPVLSLVSALVNQNDSPTDLRSMNDVHDKMVTEDRLRALGYFREYSESTNDLPGSSDGNEDVSRLWGSEIIRGDGDQMSDDLTSELENIATEASYILSADVSRKIWSVAKDADDAKQLLSKIITHLELSRTDKEELVPITWNKVSAFIKA